MITTKENLRGYLQEDSKLYPKQSGFFVNGKI